MADYFNILINEKLPNLKQFIKFQRQLLKYLNLKIIILSLRMKIAIFEKKLFNLFSLYL